MKAERNRESNRERIRERTRPYDANLEKIAAHVSSKNFKFELKTV